MPLFSVIIPTYNHCDTILWAIKSVQEQTVQDFEIIVAGDGVPDRTRDIMTKLCAEDTRIRFLDNPKDAGKGETQRHAAVMASKAEYIAGLGDDDVWQKRHLEVLATGLEDADFCNTLSSVVLPRRGLVIQPGNIASQLGKSVLLNMKFNFIGFTTAGYRKSSYLSLAEQWGPTPKGIWSDLFMWRKWLSQEHLRFKSLPFVTSIHIDSPGREDMSIAERAEESKYWLGIIRDDDHFAKLEMEALRQVTLDHGCYKAGMYHFRALYEKLVKLTGQSI
ncbi:glycosyltransferase family 2 protein [Kordiimonas sp.]|uniref:glycosyltransferase family 2 protein n=1 Tax=Kordiimonas sp. TaxID=1970157 RepID=UPI003A95B2D9